MRGPGRLSWDAFLLSLPSESAPAVRLGPGRDAGNPTPDACRVDSPERRAGGGFSQLYSLAEVPSGSAVGFVTVLAPAGTPAEAEAIVATASAKFSGAGGAQRVEVKLPALGRRVLLSADGSWTAGKLDQ